MDWNSNLIEAPRTPILNSMETTEDFEVMIEDSFQRLEKVVSKNALERIANLEEKLEQLEQELEHFLRTAESDANTE